MVTTTYSKVVTALVAATGKGHGMNAKPTMEFVFHHVATEMPTTNQQNVIGDVVTHIWRA